MDSFVLLTPESVPAPLLQRAFTAVGILDTVSAWSPPVGRLCYALQGGAFGF